MYGAVNVSLFQTDLDFVVDSPIGFQECGSKTVV